MPLYEYECAACGNRFELIRKYSDAPVEVCPTCGKTDVQKLLSSPAIQFKGTGWYITDYAKKGGAPADGADADGAAKPAAKDTDTKAGYKKLSLRFERFRFIIGVDRRNAGDTLV